MAFLVFIQMDTTRSFIKGDVNPLTISFVNEKSANEIKNLAKKDVDERVKDLSVTEKVDLYNKLKQLKSTPKNNKTVYQESNKTKATASIPANADKTATPVVTHKMITENEFNFYTTPVYVAENKLTSKEKEKLVNDRLKKEELRAKIKEKNIIPKFNVDDIKQTKTLEEIIQISQRPLIVKKDKPNEKKIEEKPLENKNTVVASNEVKEQKPEPAKPEETKPEEPQVVEEVETPDEVKTANVDDLVNTIAMNEVIIDDKYAGLSEDEIFSEEDYRRLQEIEDNKEDNKFLLSLREKRNIQRQIKGCYKMAILRSRKDSKAVVALTVDLDSDGVININSARAASVGDNFNKDGFDIALDNAKSALVFCSPLRGLPSGKYKTWRQMTFVFDSNNLE